jgi:hypothetical protein
VTSQVAFDAVTVEYPGSTTAFTAAGPVMIDRVGYLGYYKQASLQRLGKPGSCKTQVWGDIVTFIVSVLWDPITRRH